MGRLRPPLRSLVPVARNPLKRIRPGHPTFQLANRIAEAPLAGGLTALRVRGSATLTSYRQVRPERAIATHMSSDMSQLIALRRAKTRARVPAWGLHLVPEFVIGLAFELPES